VQGSGGAQQRLRLRRPTLRHRRQLPVAVAQVLQREHEAADRLRPTVWLSD
jgi:hypothetical protein